MNLIGQIVAMALRPARELAPEALALAQCSLLDWMACAIAGADEPVARNLRRLADLEGGKGTSSLVGGGRVPARMAALVNGATSHALDYDDTHFAHVGHLSVGIYPAALAVGEETGASAVEVVEAFLVGAEAAVRIGLILGRSHYNHGFHQTATAGAFGAAIAAGRLYGLDPAQMRNALGLCATRASGLKSQFGTMGKPYNAGIAASNGVECARLAQFGVTSADDGLFGAQGFVATHHAEPVRVELPGSEVFLFENNKYKLHACCHGLHAMIEALLGNDALRQVDLSNVASFELRTNPRWMSVCDIKRPRTGLEVKFSYNWLAGMTLRGEQTGNDRIYTDDIAHDAALSAFAQKVTVAADDGLSDLEASSIITLNDGARIDASHDLAAPLPHTVLVARLRSKAEAMIGHKGNALWEQFSNLSPATAENIGNALRNP
ncbi:MAG: MmgE/PrpD family protein [Rhizobiaceae bacterium]